MSDEGTVGLGRWILFWAIALGGTSFDLVTKSIVFSKVAAPPATVSVVPRILELHTSHNTGALWGFGAGLPYSSQIFAGLSVIAAVVICFWLFFLRGREHCPDRGSGLDHGRCARAIVTIALSSDTSAISSIFTSMRSASTAPSSTSPTTCWSLAR